FGAVEPMKRFRPARIRMGHCRLVDFVLQPSGHRLVCAEIWPRHSGRRHRSETQLADNLLPSLGVFTDTRDVSSRQDQLTRAHLGVVAAETVLFEHGLLGS